MRTTVVAAVFCSALLAPRVGAQVIDTVPEPRDAAKMALVRELMTVANFRDQLIRTMRETSRLQATMLPVPPEFWDKLLARATQDADTLLAPMVDDYARYFSSADLRSLIAFYRSPAGQRASLVSPVINANSSFNGSKWGQRVGAEIAADMTGGGTPPASSATPPKKKP